MPALSAVRRVLYEEVEGGCSGWSWRYFDAETGEYLFRSPCPGHRDTRGRALLDQVEHLRRVADQRLVSAKVEAATETRDHRRRGGYRLRVPDSAKIRELHARARALNRLADELLAEAARSASESRVA